MTHNYRRRTTLAAAALLAVVPASALAQAHAASGQAAPAPASSQAQASPQVTAGWRDGFFIQSEKGDFRLQIGLLVHADGRFALDDEAGTVNDTFLIRRARPYLRGRFAQRFEFYFNPDFAGGTLVVQDAYLDTIFSPAFRLRVGKAKTPFGLERLHSASNLLFYERALPTALAPNRDVGVQVLGEVAGGTVSYGGGVLNGVNDGSSADTDASDSKDVAGRVLVRPFVREKESTLRGLGIGIAATAGRQTGSSALPSFRTVSLQQPFFSYSGAAADGVRKRYSPQVSYYYKRFGGFGEYVRTEVPIVEGSARADIAHEAWQIAGAFVLTGETATDAGAGVRPRQPFDFGNGHLGAFQIAARYHTLSVDDRAVDLGFAAAGASRKAEAFTVGLNWFLTANVKYVLAFERTVFDDNADGARRPENALAFRAQLNF